MTNEEMLKLINEFKNFVRYTGKVSPMFYPAMESILNAFFTWFADRKTK